jgi:microcin C transport system substrate-binding protein
VLLHHHYVVPGYALTYSRTARWNRFSRPDTLPEFGNGFPTIWWWDAEKAAATGGASAQ